MSGQHDSRPAEPGTNRSARRRAGVILGVVAVAVLAVSAGCSSTSPKPATSATPVNGMGKPVRDAQWEYVVTKLECKATVGGDADASIKEPITSTKGKYCLVSLTLKNITTASGGFDATDQFAYDAAGTKYTFNNDASNRVVNAWGNIEVLPDHSDTEILVFDVSAATTLTRLELRATPASAPATFQLG